MKFEKISSALLFKLVRIFSLILIIFYPLMGYYFAQSGDNIGILESQLSFSAETLRYEYNHIYIVGGMDLYRLGQTLDFVFMFLYGSLIFLVCVKWGRIVELKFPQDMKIAKILYICAILGIIAALCDMVENIFILKMLATEPNWDFPDIWAIVHSSFALIKWILLAVSILWFMYVKIRYWKKGASKSDENSVQAS